MTKKRCEMTDDEYAAHVARRRGWPSNGRARPREGREDSAWMNLSVEYDGRRYGVNVLRRKKPSPRCLPPGGGGTVKKLEIYVQFDEGNRDKDGRVYRHLYDWRDTHTGSGWDGEDVPPDGLLDLILEERS